MVFQHDFHNYKELNGLVNCFSRSAAPPNKLLLGCKPHYFQKGKKNVKYSPGGVLQKSSKAPLKILKNSQNAETPVLEYLSKNAESLQKINFIKKGLQHKRFPLNFAKFFRTLFWQNTSEWLLFVFTSEFSEAFQNTFFIEHF